MMIINNKEILQQNGRLEQVLLVQDSKRITCSSFKIWIPSIMSNIKMTLEDWSEPSVDSRNINRQYQNGNVTCRGHVEATSIHGYDFAISGWIPEYKIETLTAVDETNDEISAASTNGVTEIASHAPHTHAIKAALKLITNKIKNITMNTLVATNSTEVDLMEMHRRYVTKGGVLYGSFVSGVDFKFVIQHIDSVTTYYDEDTDNNSNDQISIEQM